MKRNGLVLFVWIVTILVGGGRAIDEVYIIGQRYVWVTGTVTYLPSDGVRQRELAGDFLVLYQGCWFVVASYILINSFLPISL